MPVEARLLWVLGGLSLFGLFFWVSILLPSTSTPRMQKGWSWLQWRPLPHDLPQWMTLAFLAAMVLQYSYVTFVLPGTTESLPAGVQILISILCFQGVLAATLFIRLQQAKLDVPGTLGLDAPFRIREINAGLVGYCMALPLVGLAGLFTQGIYGVFDWEISAQPLLKELSGLSGWMNWVTLFLLVGFIGPLLEEVIFRGFLFTWLRQRMGIHAGLWLQALIFALIHQFGAGLLPLFALSIVLGLAYVYTQRLMVCVWLHVFFNTVTLINVIVMTSEVP